MWLYKNPKSEETISVEMLFVISSVVPFAVIIILAILRKDNIDGVQASLALTLTLGLNGVITNMIKVLVGRPRPDYFWRCYPNGAIPLSLKCDGNPDEIIEGRKSFPSGHSSFAFSGLGFLSLYLAGKLHCFQTQGRSQGWKLCAALAPVACALALALTRYSDYRHHWQGTLVLTTTVFFQFDASTQMNNSIGSWLERSLSCIRSLPHVVLNNFVALTESVEVGSPRHPGATTIGSQLQDGDRSVGWQNLTTQP
ncbi:phospholipid phosphatase 4-like isoform X3 [Acropora palmata]